MSAPLVSILMPVYNGARFLAEAVAGVTGQTLGDFELLIIDDGSTDESADLAAGFSDSRIRVLRNDVNLGLVKTLNRGLAEARGEWIARCDADDIWLPGKLAAQFALAHQDPRLALIGTGATLIDERGNFRGHFRTPANHDALRWDLCFRNPFVHSTVLFRREMALEEGGYRDIPAAEDYDLWSRMAARAQVASVPARLVQYRLHGSSVMARENAAGRQKSYSFLGKIMTLNLHALRADALVPLIDVWLEPSREPARQARFWREYARACPVDAREAVGEHVLNMLYRQRRFSGAAALAFLRVLPLNLLLRMPWLRALGALRTSA